MTESRHRQIRSFVLRQGRLTTAQQNALDNYWKLYGIDFNNSKLDFEAIFKRNAPVTLEVGFGNGDSLLEQAINNPDRDFIGIEVHRPGVGHLLNRIHQESISNLRVIRHDAVEVLNNQIPENSLDCVQLFFPDPWHKKRHHKRRIMQHSFVENIRKHLQKTGSFHMATDWENYAEHMFEVMENSADFTNTAGKKRFVSANGLRPITKFEKRGQKLGHSVWDLVYKKNN